MFYTAIGMAQQYGLLHVISPDELNRQEQKKFAADAALQDAVNQADKSAAQYSSLASYIRTKFDQFRNHRNSYSGWNERLLNAQRVFNGQYDAAKLAQIKVFGGSDIYFRVVAVKCRGASSLLRDVYLGGTRPWGLDATPNPVLPDDVTTAVMQLVQAEYQSMVAAGQTVSPEQVKDRIVSLQNAADMANKAKARDQARASEEVLDDYLVEGEFYIALAEFLVDLPLFPFACIKGPVVKVVPDVVWQNGKAAIINKPKMFWNRVSPFDLFFSPGVGDIKDADVIERLPLRRQDLNDVMDLPGYNKANIIAVLTEYGQGFHENIDSTDSERAISESREDPSMNTTGIIDSLEFNGMVQGSLLLEYGMDPTIVTDPIRDYNVQCWLVGRYVIKAQISPSPRKRHPYYISSFEKVPGTPIGNALPDILGDCQDLANATVRALVNNLSIASGPQVMIDVSRLTPDTDADDLHPWKRWKFEGDPMVANNGQRPVDFFQPASITGELMAVYEKTTQIADETSAIPRYTTGSERLGGAGRTASGLAMLQNNASKVMLTVAANIDRDIFYGILEGLYDMVMLTDDSGKFRGDESIHVRGVEQAVQRETNRQRQLEFLQATANPIDFGIMGPLGRATVLREVSKDLALTGSKIVPPDDIIQAKMQADQQQAMAMGQLPGQKDGQPSSGGPQGMAPSAPGGTPRGAGVTPQAKPSNQALGVPEASQMRRMT